MTLLDEPSHQVLYEPATPPRRRRVSTALVVGVALTLLLLTAAVLWMAGRHPSRPAAATPSPATAANPPVSTDAGEAVPASPGATRVVHGVPVGYPRDPSGAVAAATGYLVAQSDPQMYVAARRHDVIRTIAAPGSADDLIAQIDPGLQLAARGFGVDAQGHAAGGPLVSRVMPLGWRLDSYTPDRARVTAWYGTLAGVAGLHSQAPVTSEFATDSIDLQWAEGDWKWSGLVHAAGPAPVGGVQPPSSADQIALAISTFHPYAYGGSR